MIEALLALSRADTVLDLRKRSANAFADAGYHAAYYIAPLSAVRNGRSLLTNSGFPDEWESEYRNKNYKVDPLPWVTLTAGHPVVWNDLPGTVRLSAEEVAYLNSLAAFGMGIGVGIATYGPRARIGFVGIGRPERSEVAPSDVAILRIIAQTSFLRYCDLIQDEIGDMPELSPRELDVLGRISQGKTKVQIARDLKVSKDTVDTYFRRIYAKLDVSDRGAAVATAVARGVLVPTDTRLSTAMMGRQPTGQDKKA